MGEARRKCELCSGEATVYCPSDTAFLCRSCDLKVHGANFLVARHLRTCLCSSCGTALGRRRYSGASITFPAGTLCRSCSPTVDESLSSSSSCVSSTTDAGEEADSGARTRRRSGAPAAVAVDSKVEGVLVNWCRRMGVEERRVREVVPTALEFLGGCCCVDRMTLLPFRVSLTASLWVAMKVCSGGATCHDLSKLERISGVPAKLVLATESRLARGVKLRRSRDNHEEGWAEC